jgi:hypothetical protein
MERIKKLFILYVKKRSSRRMRPARKAGRPAPAAGTQQNR